MHGDVRDAAAVARAVDGVDGVFHLAAEVGVGQSMYEVARYVGSNDLGTAVLLEQLISAPVERLVVASSMSVYGEGRYVNPDGVVVDLVQRQLRDVSGENAAQWDPALPDGRSLTPVATDEAKQVDLASIYALTKFVQERSCLMVARTYGMRPWRCGCLTFSDPVRRWAIPIPGTGEFRRAAAARSTTDRVRGRSATKRFRSRNGCGACLSPRHG